MATVSDVLKTTEDYLGKHKVTPELKALAEDLADTTGTRVPALTNELAADTLIARYPQILGDLPAESDPSLPTVQGIVRRFGKEFHLGNTNDPFKAAEAFVESFSKNAGKWKEVIAKDPKFGTRGWEAVKETFRQTVPQVEQEKAKRARADEVGLVEKIFFPRSTERYVEGGEVQPKDWALDIGEDVAMALPTTGVGALSKIPRVGKVLGSPLAKSVVAGAAIPVSAEIADAVAYDEGEGMDDRVNFRPTDVLRGTAVNTGAGLGLYKVLGPTGRILSGDLSGEGSRVARDLIERVGTTSRSRLKDRADAVKKSISDVLASPAGPVTEGSLKSAGSRGAAVARESAADDAFRNAVADKSVMDLVDAGILKMKPLNEVRKHVDALEGARSSFREAFAKQAEKAADDAVLAGDLEGAAKKMLDARTMRARTGRTPGVRASDVLSGLSEAADANKSMALSAEQINAAFRRNPELYAYVLANTKNDFTKAGLRSAIENALSSNIAPFAVNKIGRNEWAGRKLNQALGTASETLDRDKAAAKERHAGAVSKILEANRPSLTAEDELYLKRIQENPDYLKFNKDDPAFKVWLLERGHKLLEGTPAARPTWDVE